VAGAMGIMVHETKIEVLYGLISHSGQSCKSILSSSMLFDAVNPLDISSKNTESTEEQIEGGKLIVFSGDSKKPALHLTLQCMESKVLSENLDDGRPCPSMKRLLTGGCGNKFYNVQKYSKSNRKSQRGVGAMSIGPPGSCSWDTAAPTAVLLASDPNARVTDLIGNPLVYDGVRLSNSCGVLVSSGTVANEIHSRLTKGLRQDKEFCELMGVVFDDTVWDTSGQTTHQVNAGR